MHTGETKNAINQALDNDQTELPIYFYIDGVPPSKSGTKKMIMEAFRLPCCRAMIHFATIHYESEHDVCADDLLLGLIEELKDVTQVRVKLLIADLPERCRLTGLVNFNAMEGCLTCFATGESRERAGGGYVYPLWTTKEPLRDDVSFKNLSDVADAVGKSAGGVKRYSVLLDIPHFSIKNGLAIDPMHLLAGLTKYLWETTLTKAGKRDAAEIREQINRAYTRLDVPSDFKRGVRAVAFKQFKWNEWKALLCLCGLDIAEAFEDILRDDLGLIWRLLMFATRAMAQGDEWYAKANKNGTLVRATIDRLYAEVESTLGKDSCLPNLHNLSHLPSWRDR